MHIPSSRHLSYEFKAYKELTLRELFFISLITTLTTCFIFVFAGLMLGWAVILGCVGFLVGFIVSITMLPKPISRLKANKPHGYLLKQALIRLADFGLVQSPFISHQDYWHTSKSARQKDV